MRSARAGKAFKGPDHYLNGRLPNYPGDSSFEVRRSGGFESMAKSPDGKTIYPMFEWPLCDAQAKAVESRQGKPHTRILELDVATQRDSERQWKYQFEEAGHVAADFQMLDATTGLVIERDDATEGAGPNCPNEPRVDCFTRPAKFKRIYKIDFSQLDADGFVKKIAFIDLTKTGNPNRLARRGPNEASFVLPHLGPEGLTLVDAAHIVVVTGNNFPFSSGRKKGWRRRCTGRATRAGRWRERHEAWKTSKSRESNGGRQPWTYTPGAVSATVPFALFSRFRPFGINKRARKAKTLDQPHVRDGQCS